ncbi:MAG: type I DNA topoisomerase [Candidatus Cloacimonetes bacterium]|nr:type I DNA topoisomerase [Candidatus Cloacimonadota bacterium]
MGRPLIIVESPAKAKTISKYLDNKFIVKASMGHVRDLPKKEIGVDLENNFEPFYVIDVGKKALINELKKSANESDSLYLAPDNDREGEAIAWHLAFILEKEIKNKPVYRIVFNEITKKAINEAIKNPSQIDINKVDAQQARRVLDRIVGYKISPLLWKLLSSGLSAGRVQSVALRLICEIDNEIKAFIPEEYWSVEADFWKDKLPPFKATLQQFEGKKIDLKNKEQTDEILKDLQNNQSKISSYKQSEREIQPPPPYITSTLQQDASRLINFTGKKTMSVAQQLYEGLDIEGETLGLITYMRTDSVRIATEANEALREFLEREYGKEKVLKTIRIFTNKNAAQDAHEAIRPTYPWRTPESLKSSLSRDQFKLYEIIWKRFTASQMINMRLSTVALEISCGRGIFKTSGSVVLENGFFDVYPHINVSMGENIHKDYKIEDLLEKTEIIGKQHFTKPPAYFTEAQLIKELESKGIGRPSTYASITNTIVERKYVEIKEKKFYPTDLGHAVNKFLVSNFDKLFNVSFTAEMENKLDDIEYGKQEWVSLLSEYYGSIKELIGGVNIKETKKEMTEETDILCDLCANKMVVKMSKTGQFLGCSNYPKCRNIKNFKKDENGDFQLIDRNPQETGIKCEKCGSEMVIKRSRKGVEFIACSGYPKCKNAMNFKREGENIIAVSTEPKTTDEKCSKCGKDMLVRNGRYGEFLACSGYPKCKNIQNIATGVKCPLCKEGNITRKKGKNSGVFYSCTKYPDCKYISNYKPVETKCKECGHYFLEERPMKTGEPVLVCPECNKEYF